MTDIRKNLEAKLPFKLPRPPAWITRPLPFIISGAILYHYLRGMHWHELGLAMSQSVIWLAVAGVVAPQLGMWITNTVSNAVTMTWFHGPFPFWKYFWVRGAAFILQMINNPLAQTGSLLYIRKKTDIEWKRLLGIVAFRVQLGVWGFCAVMIPVTIMLQRSDAVLDPRFNLTAWWIFLIMEALFLAGSWGFWHYGLDPTRLGRLIVRDRQSEFWRAFRLATPGQWLITWAILVPQITLVIFGYYFLAVSFHVVIPFWKFVILMPLVLFISNAPIAFGGFGATTLAWSVFFGQYGTAENIAALSLFIPAGRLLLRATLGLISLKPAMSEVGDLLRPPDLEVAQTEPMEAEPVEADLPSF